jgi:xylulokinase
MCINGAGSMNSLLRQTLSSNNKGSISYAQMDELALTVDPGSDGLAFLPFGNGAERILGNKEVGASVHGLNLNVHTTAHKCRATQEGIAFAMGYGFEMLKGMNIRSSVIRAAHANMFRSKVFCETFAAVTGEPLELFDTDGSQGAASGAGVGDGHYNTPLEALVNLRRVRSYVPEMSGRKGCLDAFDRWKGILKQRIA